MPAAFAATARTAPRPRRHGRACHPPALHDESIQVLAVDAASAMAQLRRHRPDIILMDIQLPGLDGVALTQRFKAAPHLASIPIVIMTGNASKTTLLSSMEAGAAAFVVKPFTRESLTSKLMSVLSR